MMIIQLFFICAHLHSNSSQWRNFAAAGGENSTVTQEGIEIQMPTTMNTIKKFNKNHKNNKASVVCVGVIQKVNSDGSGVITREDIPGETIWFPHHRVYGNCAVEGYRVRVKFIPASYPGGRVHVISVNPKPPAKLQKKRKKKKANKSRKPFAKIVAAPVESAAVPFPETNTNTVAITKRGGSDLQCMLITFLVTGFLVKGLLKLVGIM